MKIQKIDYLIKYGKFSESVELEKILSEIKNAIHSMTWPEGNEQFTIHPVKKANGVVPIKKKFMSSLIQHDWKLEHRMFLASRLRPGPIDAVKKTSDNQFFAVEWETGNISSSHRALNKMAIGLIDGVLAGGILILPSRKMYQYLTDRVGNYAEIQPYFPVWRSLDVKKGVLAVIGIEHDSESIDVPIIRKGTDGRAIK